MYTAGNIQTKAAKKITLRIESVLRNSNDIRTYAMIKVYLTPSKKYNFREMFDKYVLGKSFILFDKLKRDSTIDHLS